MKKKIFLSTLLAFGIFLVWIMAGTLAHSAEKAFPSRQIEFVVPYPPGGSLDVTVRAMNEELSRNFGVPTVIVNKSAGSSSLGTEYAAHAKPDGYTLLVGNNAIFVTVPATTGNLPYKTSDFLPIACVGFTPNCILVRKESPFKTLEELIGYAKKNPGKLKCATSGPTGSSRFSLELLKSKAGIDIQHVPFAGGPPANTATLGGHVDLLSSTFSGVIGLVKAGDLRGLAVGAEKRMADFPDILTLSEKGYPETSLSMWVGFFAPRGVEKPIFEKISAVIEKTSKNPEVIKKIKEVGNEYEYTPGDKVSQQIENEYKMVVDVIKKAKLTF
ncbi:MAG: Bug family tripartite tricarboxylate transporter substrate binding protein [Thermodesulfobacteriota bacterium]